MEKERVEKKRNKRIVKNEKLANDDDKLIVLPFYILQQ